MIDPLPDMNPLVTVIMVTYNSDKYVRDAIESVLQNSYPNFELVISDDNSKDKTWEIIQSYKDSRIRSIRNENNIGEYPNRNQALKQARGEYSIFIDGDDILLYRGIENAIKEMLRYPECSFGIVKPENPKYIGPLKVSQIDIIGLEMTGNGILDSALCNNVFRSDFLKDKLLFNQYKNSDTYSRMYFSFFSPVLILIDPIAIWRITPGQASGNIKFSTRLEESNHFYFNYLLPLNQQFNLVDQDQLKRNYYRNLVKCMINRVKKFKTIKDLLPFFQDNFASVFQYILKQNKNQIWSIYNYENIHIYFRQ
jgi:glycosyltransferase involved in cell wall biosynthesis